jgi:hypothetical protein
MDKYIVCFGSRIYPEDCRPSYAEFYNLSSAKEFQREIIEDDESMYAKLYKATEIY